MAERKATNKYMPPSYDPDKHGSLNTFHGTHALRERASRRHLGIMVIRFEMPHDAVCLGCGAYIGRGVRYNADKSCVGAYHSTKVWSFTFKCAECPNRMTVRTDPQQARYVAHHGVRWKRVPNQGDAADQAAVVAEAREARRVVVEDTATRQRRAEDPLAALEHASSDASCAAARAPALQRLQRLRHSRSADDYASSCALRAAMRQRKAADAAAAAEADALGLAGVRLLPPSHADAALAAQVRFPSKQPAERRHRRAQRRQRRTSQGRSFDPSVFAHTAVNRSTAPRRSPSALRIPVVVGKAAGHQGRTHKARMRARAAVSVVTSSKGTHSD